MSESNKNEFETDFEEAISEVCLNLGVQIQALQKVLLARNLITTEELDKATLEVMEAFEQHQAESTNKVII